MSLLHQCSKCGYSSKEEYEIVCPICGGIMVTTTSDSACDRNVEQKWNNGYHNDFSEQRKTGDYCDPKFEKLTNGGEHYHNLIELDENQDKIITKIFLFICGLVFGAAFNISLMVPVLACLCALKAKRKKKGPAKADPKLKLFIVGLFIGAILFIFGYVGYNYF